MTDTTAAHRDPVFMQAFLDVALPPSADGKMPGAGGLGLAEGVADALEADAMLGPFVQAGLQAVRDAASVDPGGFQGLPAQARVELVKRQLSSHPFLMMGLAYHLYPAYYAHPRVLEAIGEPPRAPFPEGFEIEPTDPSLLDKLRQRARGP